MVRRYRSTHSTKTKTTDDYGNVHAKQPGLLPRYEGMRPDYIARSSIVRHAHHDDTCTAATSS